MNPKIKTFQSKLQANMVQFQKVESVNHEIYKVLIPFTYDNGDQISIYLIHDEKDGWHFTDEGLTLWEMNLRWGSDLYFEKKNKNMIIKLCGWNGVAYKVAHTDKNSRIFDSQLIKYLPEIESGEDIIGLVNPLCEYLHVILSLIQRERQMRWDAQS